MRIIAGLAKGRKLKVPKTTLRPLSDQARESLFNILINKTADSVFLDLFAGSGAVGLEALSRGAKLAIFVEKDRKAVATIRENIHDLGFSDRSEVFSVDVSRALNIFQKNNGKFDIIFMGAPYGSPDLISGLKFIGEVGFLSPNGVLIAEHRHKTNLEEEYGSLKKIREQRYGDTVFSFYKETQ